MIALAEWGINLVQIDLNEGVERLNYSMKIQGMQDSAINFVICFMRFDPQKSVKRLIIRTLERVNS